MQNYSQYVKSDYIFHEPRELLPMPVSILLGVGQDAEEILKFLQIFSVFDLATSHIFGNARKIVEVAGSTNTTFGRYGGVPADVVDNDGHHFDVTELQMQPVELLEGIGPNNGPKLIEALQTQKIRDLALWPPYVAASKIVTSILTPEDTPEYDPEAPADLIPKSGEFPTEKVFYSTVVIDQIDGGGSTELDGQIDLADISMGDAGFKKPATGAIITMEQAWYAQGVALGNLLHSVALAPGESTKIAMVDWSRETSASQDSMTNQEESLSRDSSHNRAISEVTSAVATEAQGGFSNTTSVGTSTSFGAGWGGMLGSGLMGVTQSTSMNASTATTVSASFGRRDLMASMNQNVADRTQQHANSARTRRASVIQEVSQKEQETLTTRTVTNYNHMHALSVQYYEVVQIYRTTTRVNKVEKCLFIPMKPIDFSNMNSIDRFRHILSSFAINDNARLALDTKVQLVEIRRMLNLHYPTWLLALNPSGSSSSNSNSASKYFVEKLADEQLLIEEARSATGNYVAEDATRNVPLPSWQLRKEVVLTKIESQHTGWKKVTVNLLNRPDVVLEAPQANDKVGIVLDPPVPISEVGSIYAEYNVAPTGLFSFSGIDWTLTFSYEGREFRNSSLMRVAEEDAIQINDSHRVEFIRFKYSGYALSDWLLRHLDENRLYYSQAVWMNMGSAALSMLMSRYSYEGQPLLQQMDPIPIAITGNYLGFRMNADPVNDENWREWLVLHGYYKDDSVTPKNTAVHETVPLPSGGVFAEAVLGRFNSAEKLDMTRFWNWQDSPIPFAAPEIAALQAGGKSQNITPGTDGLETPIIQQMAPTNLPDPQGLSAIINALTSANMFRDMSGLAQTAALAQAALNAASAADTAAGNQAGANMATGGQYSVEMAKAVMPLLTMAAGAAMGVPVPPMGGDQGKTNISNAGAIQNEAAKIDAKKRAAKGGSGSPGGGNTPQDSSATAYQEKGVNTLIDGKSPTVANSGKDIHNGGEQTIPLPIESIPLDPVDGGQSIDVDALDYGDIIVSTTSESVSGIIRWATESEISHAALYVGGGMVVEAVADGVELKTLEEALSDDSLAVAFRHPSITEQEALMIRDFAGQQLDKPYNKWGIVNQASFILDKKVWCSHKQGADYVRCVNWAGQINLGKENDSSFYCSELVIAAYRHVGVSLTNQPPHWSSPQDIVELSLRDKLGYVGHLKTP